MTSTNGPVTRNYRVVVEYHGCRARGICLGFELIEQNETTFNKHVAKKPVMYGPGSVEPWILEDLMCHCTQ